MSSKEEILDKFQALMKEKAELLKKLHGGKISAVGLAKLDELGTEIAALEGKLADLERSEAPADEPAPPEATETPSESATAVARPEEPVPSTSGTSAAAARPAEAVEEVAEAAQSTQTTEKTTQEEDGGRLTRSKETTTVETRATKQARRTKYTEALPKKKAGPKSRVQSLRELEETTVSPSFLKRNPEKAAAMRRKRTSSETAGPRSKSARRETSEKDSSSEETPPGTPSSSAAPTRAGISILDTERARQLAEELVSEGETEGGRETQSFEDVEAQMREYAEAHRVRRNITDYKAAEDEIKAISIKGKSSHQANEVMLGKMRYTNAV